MAVTEFPDSGVTAAGRDDHRSFTGQSQVHPLQRLARFRTMTGIGPGIENRKPGGDVNLADQPTGSGDAKVHEVGPEQFHELREGELEDVPRVYVFVHGWLPGSKEAADTLVAQHGQVTAWDERVSNTVGRTLINSYSPLLSALARRDPDAAVLWFSWVDQSSTDTEFFAARDSFRNTEVNGRRLAIALQDAFGDGLPQIHMIGHSHGCVVATHASLALEHPPRHLTLLDCPEDWFSRAGGAAGLLDSVLPRLQPDRGDTPTFVDSYSSMFGRSYHGKPGLAGVVDVRLAPRFSGKQAETAASQAHQYAVDWYAETVGDTDRDEGFAWSPMRGFDTSELSAAYLHALSGPMITLASYKSGAESSANIYEVENLVVPPQSLSRGESDLALIINTAPSAIFVEFDYDIRRPGRKTTLEVAIDRQLKFVADADVKVPGRGRYLRLDPSSGDSAVLQFRIHEPGMFTAVTVQRIRVLRGESRSKNYDDRRAAAAIAALGAFAGSAVTLTLVGAGLVLRGALRRNRC